MRILILYHSDIISPKPGADEHIYTTAKMLSESNCVTVLTWGTGDIKKFQEKNLKIVHIGNNRTVDYSQHKKIPYYIIDLVSYFGIYYILFLRKAKGPSSRVFSQLNLGAFDVAIHIAFDNNKILKYLKNYSNTKVVELSLVSGLPHYLHNVRDWFNYIHDHTFLSIFLLKTLNKIMSRIVSWFYVSSLSSNKVISISEYDRKMLNNVKHLDVVYMPPIHDFGEYFDSVEENNTILFFSGKSMAATIAINYIFVAAKKLPQYNFYITGFTPMNTVNYGKVENVKMLGYVDEIKFHKVIAKSSLIIMPLISGSGFQTKLAESLMRAKPIITTSVIACEFPDLVNMEQIIVEDDPREFTNKIKELMDNKELRLKLSRNAKEYYDSHLNSSLALKLHLDYLEKIKQNS